MTMKTKLGDQTALPIQTKELIASGLTKRELFAAMAMQGLLSNYDGLTFAEMAAKALTFSDALLVALEKVDK